MMKFTSKPLAVRISPNLASADFGIPVLQGKWGSLVGSLILGVFVSFWILPQFFNKGSPLAAMGGLSFFPFFILIEVGWSFMTS